MGRLNIPLPWGDDAPEHLVMLCAKTVIENPETYCERAPLSLSLKPGLALPQELCEKLINTWQDKEPRDLDDSFLGMFSDLSRTRLKRVILRGSSVSDAGLHHILKHKLLELDISSCKNLTNKSVQCINENAEHLTSLCLGSCTKLFAEKEYLLMDDYGNYMHHGPVLNTPKLKRLIARDIIMPRESDFFSRLLRPLSGLTHLDLSSCTLSTLDFVRHLENLTVLILHGVQYLQDAVPAICSLTKLRYLDISQVNKAFGSFTNADLVLETIMESLPHLTGLDISGTNLPGDGTFDKIKLHKRNCQGDSAHNLYGWVDTDGEEVPLCDIPGLQSRVSNPLEFLGLCNTYHDACTRKHIPAEVVAGEANESQVLAATEAYLDRPEMLMKSLNELFHLFRYDTCHDQKRALSMILSAMMRHRFEKQIQISGSASLFYIAKSEEKTKLSIYAKRKMISILINAMETHIDDSTMMRNGCLTICQFSIPQDVIFDYCRLVKLLLRLVQGKAVSEDFVKRLAIYLLNSLACQVDGQQKELIGNLGAIETMLDLINDKLATGMHDDVLEIAWSTMWNVTDETPINCQRFLDGDGMSYFQKCLVTFSDKEELLRNMMGLLGNVAEVEYLRPRLITSELISTFTELLDSQSDGIEVSYNAAGVLSHIASDGPSAWNIETPTRNYVLRKMVAAIERWDLSKKRNINYRSFEPILRLLKVIHTPECQHWAAWALANLTRVYPDKYCTLVEMECGTMMLQELIDSGQPNRQVIHLAKVVLHQCVLYKEHGTLEGMDLDVPMN